MLRGLDGGQAEWGRPRVAYDLHPDGDRLVAAQNVSSTTSEDDYVQPERLILIQNFFEELRQVVPEP